MKSVIALLAVLSLSMTGRPEVNERSILALVPRAGGLDAYWHHLNELATPPFERLKVTRLALDGSRRGSAVVLDAFIHSVGWAGGDAAPIALWNDDSEMLRAATIGDSALEPQAGKIVSEYTTYPGLICGGQQCAAVWSWGSSWYAVYLDEEGSPKGPSFALPQAWLLYDVVVDESGLFVVRRISNDIRAALIRPDGSVQYDVLLFHSPANEFAEPIVSADFDGTAHVVAYAQRPPGNELKATVIDAVTIAENGALQPAHTLIDAGPRGIETFSLAWNGTQHLLAWTSGAALRASRFTPQLSALDAEPRAIDTSVWLGIVIAAMPDGTFAIGWSRSGAPNVALLRPDGELTASVAIDPAPRRRAAGK
ncbi:MAG: hypothetical protein ACJ74H_09425 [Thermoanaerobaculia bacterium]